MLYSKIIYIHLVDFPSLSKSAVWFFLNIKQHVYTFLSMKFQGCFYEVSRLNAFLDSVPRHDCGWDVGDESIVVPADILVQLAAFSPTVQPDSAYTLEPRHLVAAKNIMTSILVLTLIFSLKYDCMTRYDLSLHFYCKWKFPIFQHHLPFESLVFLRIPEDGKHFSRVDSTTVAGWFSWEMKNRAFHFEKGFRTSFFESGDGLIIHFYWMISCIQKLL